MTGITIHRKGYDVEVMCDDEFLDKVQKYMHELQLSSISNKTQKESEKK